MNAYDNNGLGTHGRRSIATELSDGLQFSIETLVRAWRAADGESPAAKQETDRSLWTL
jgi:hypothetical protein